MSCQAGKSSPLSARRLCAILTVCALLVAVTGPNVSAASRYDPRLRFRAVSTPHFVIYFHQGEETLGRRLAAIAEEVHVTLARRLAPRWTGRTHVILVDQSDLPSGWATPLPHNTIEISAAPPQGDNALANTGDWLRYVFQHEYAHILHLDRSNGWAAALRPLFGRMPLLFPNLFLPVWQVEGLATLEEGTGPDSGRLHAGDFREILRAESRTGRLEPLDRINGGLDDWPSGAGPYVYGGYFHEYLAHRFGRESLTRLADLTAGSLPFLTTPSFTAVFGTPLRQLWREFEQTIISTEDSPAVGVRRLTTNGFVVTGPRWSRDGTRVFYSGRDAHDFPWLRVIRVADASVGQVATRYLGNAVAVGDDVIYFDQLELERSVALGSDLYGININPHAGRTTGRVRRLTYGARVVDPDLSADNKRIVCVVIEPGRRSLAMIELDASAASRNSRLSPKIIVSEAATRFAVPRWSPDGRLIVVERRRLEGPSEIVLVDPDDRTSQVLAASTSGRVVSPTWMPDGHTVIFAAERDGGPFDLYAVDVERRTLQRVTRVSGGARSPDVSPDGRQIVYVGYTPDGYDLFVMAVDRSQWTDMPSFAPADAVAGVESAERTSVEHPRDRSYSPLSTILPRHWTPQVAYDDDGAKIGVSTTASDVLGRHSYGARVMRSLGSRRIEARGYYAYDRWRPTLVISGSTRSLPWSGAMLRERTMSLAGFLPVRHVRDTQTFLGGLTFERSRFECTGSSAIEACGRRANPTSRNAVRFGWMMATTRFYDYSVSNEQGIVASVSSEHVRRALGAGGNADAVTAEVRFFTRLGSRHSILAVRAGTGAATGNENVRRLFTLGGNGPKEASFNFGHDALALLRGFPSGKPEASRVAVLNVDYRFPLVRIERGRGTWPLFVRTLHGAIFADAGQAWNGRPERRLLKTSVGAEMSLDVFAGYSVPVTMTAGVAWRRDQADRTRDGIAFYGRIGRAF